MKEFYRKIDAHGHFGNSFLGPESRLDVYLPEAKHIGVVGTIASPGPTPEIVNPYGKYHPCLWQKNEDGTISYFQQWSDHSGSVIKTEKALPDPYRDSNLSLFDQVQGTAITPKVFVMPIHHPKLDTASGVQEVVHRFPSVALKIHGISTFTGPEDVPIHTIEALQQARKPLVVHTDMYRGEESHLVHQAYKMNDPVEWILWAREMGVFTLITHGARLSNEAIELAKKTPNVVIGIAPDLLLMTEPERLAFTPDDYLETLLQMVPVDKLVYDIDFGWNVSERNQWDTLDWQMHERIIEAGRKVGLTNQHFENIFYNNAVKFFNI